MIRMFQPVVIRGEIPVQGGYVTNPVGLVIEITQNRAGAAYQIEVVDGQLVIDATDSDDIEEIEWDDWIAAVKAFSPTPLLTVMKGLVEAESWGALPSPDADSVIRDALRVLDAAPEGEQPSPAEEEFEDR